MPSARFAISGMWFGVEPTSRPEATAPMSCTASACTVGETESLVVESSAAGLSSMLRPSRATTWATVLVPPVSVCTASAVFALPMVEPSRV